MIDTKRPVWRFLRIALISVLSIVGLVLVTALIALGVLATDQGRNWAGAFVLDTVSTPGELELSADRFTGTWPWAMGVEGLIVRDGAGAWLTAERAGLTVDPWALLSGRLHVNALSVTAPVLLRLPEGPPEEPAAPDALSFPQLPDLPVTLVIDRATVSDAMIGEAAFGQAARLDLSASGSWAGRTVAAEIDLLQTDRDGLFLRGDFAHDPSNGLLRFDLRGGDRAGGVLSAVAGDPDLGAVSLSLQSGGSAQDWQGEAVIDADAFGSSRLAAQGGWTDGQALDLVWIARPGRALGQDLRAAVGEEVRLETQLDANRSLDGEMGFSFREFELSTAVMTVTGNLGVSPERRAAGGARVGGHIDADLKDVLSLLEGGEPVTVGDGLLTLDLSGDLGAPQAQLSVSAQTIGAGAVTVAAADLMVQVAPENGAGLLVTAEGEASGIDPGLADGAWPFGDRAVLRLRARIDPDRSLIRLDETRLEAKDLALEADGQWDLDRETGSADVTVSMPRLSAAVPDLLSGGQANARIQIAKSASDTDYSVSLKARAGDLAFLETRYEEAIGRAASLTGEAAIDPSGAVQVSSLTVRSQIESLVAEAAGSFAPDTDTVDAQGRLAASDMSIFGALAGMPLEGSLNADLSVSGSLDAPVLSAAVTAPTLQIRDLALSALSADAKVAPDRGGQAIAFDLAFLTRNEALDEAVQHTATLDMVWRDEALPEIEMLSANLLGIEASHETGPQTVQFETKSLAPLSRSIRAVLGPDSLPPVDGGLKGEVRLGDQPGLTAKGSEWAVSLQNGAPVEVQSFSLSGAYDAGRTDTPITMALEAFGLRTDGRELRKLTASANGTLQSLAFQLDAKDPQKEGLRASLAGTYTDAEAAAIAVTDLDLDHRAGRARLVQPFTVTLSQTGPALSPLILSVADKTAQTDGTVEASWEALETGWSARVTLDALPLNPLTMAAGMPSPGGTGTGQITLSTRPVSPSATIDLAFEGLGAGGNRDPARLILQGQWTGQRLRLDGQLSQTGREAAAIQLGLPLPAGPSGLPVLDETAALSGKITADGRLEAIWPYFPLPEHRVKGAITADLVIRGTVAAPLVNGQVKVDKGRYENLDTGLILRRVSLTATADGQAGTIAVDARDRSEGRLEGEGQIAFGARGLRLDTMIGLDNVLIVSRDDVTAVASGKVALTGTSRDGYRAEGKIRLDDVDVIIPDQLPPNVVNLEAVEVYGSQDVAEETSENGKTPPVTVTLAITVKAEDTVRVRGRGLDALWNGDLRITGTARDTRVTGDVAMRRGRLDFLSRQFNLTRGTISFDGGRDIDPRLFIEAQYEATEVTAIATITGTASNPKVELSSQPPLPQDAILARLLFGKDPGALSTFEVVQLADALATLSRGAGSTSLIGKVQNALGIDVFQVNMDEDAEDGSLTDNVSVTVGKYVREDVFVGVTQGTQPGTSAVTVEVQLTDHLTVHTDLAQSAESSVGVRWRWDY